MATEMHHISTLGLVPFTIVMVSLLFIILAAVLGRPRRSKVPLILVGSLGGLLAVFILMFWVGGGVLALFVP